MSSVSILSREIVQALHPERSKLSYFAPPSCLLLFSSYRALSFRSFAIDRSLSKFFLWPQLFSPLRCISRLANTKYIGRKILAKSRQYIPRFVLDSSPFTTEQMTLPSERKNSKISKHATDYHRIISIRFFPIVSFVSRTNF